MRSVQLATPRDKDDGLGWVGNIIGRYPLAQGLGFNNSMPGALLTREQT